MIPGHKTYVEPYAGGAAVYFKKEPSQKEVLGDKDTEIAFAFKFLRNMTEEQFNRLKRFNWKATLTTFGKVKAMKPQNEVERFYKFYYLRWCSFGAGGISFSKYRENQTKDISRLQKIHNRLARTRVHSSNALALIDRYDSSQSFFYLDPPYPGRAFIGQSFKEWTEEDLAKLITKLKGIKGKFALSLGIEHAKLLPRNWHINRVKVWRRIPARNGDFNQTHQYEIIATNYKPSTGIVSAPKLKLTRRLLRRRNNHRSKPITSGIATSK